MNKLTSFHNRYPLAFTVNRGLIGYSSFVERVYFSLVDVLFLAIPFL